MGFLLVLTGWVLLSLSVEGNRFFSDRELLQASGLERGVVFRRPLVQRAAWTMEALYREKGFLDVRVTFSVHRRAEGVDVVFQVEEGPRYRVGDVVVLDAGPLLTPDLFRRMLPRMPYLDEEVLGRAQRRIVRFHQDRGYPFASLERENEKRDDTTVVLRYRLKGGPFVVIQEIRATTSGGLSLRRILKATGIRPPEVFQQYRLEEAIRNLYRMRVVQGVSYRPETLEVRGDTLKLALRFQILEREPRYFRVGTGFQTPNRMEGMVGMGHRNLWGNGQELEMLAAGAFRFDLLDRMSYEQITLTYREPFFLGLNASSFLQATYLLDLDRPTQEVGVRWTLERSWDERVISRTSLSWRKNFTGLVGITNTLEEVVMVEGRDNPLDPSRGYWVSVGHTHAGGWLQGDHTFERSVVDIRVYLPLSRDLLVAFRMRGGWFWGFPDPATIPPVDLFTLGGDGSLRGYPLNTVGPFRPEASAFAYGTLLGNINTELRLRGRGIRVRGIRIPLGAALFWDVGLLDVGWPPREKFRHSVGMGIRLHSLAVPLRLDVGVALPSGNQEIHFALGHMF